MEKHRSVRGSICEVNYIGEVNSDVKVVPFKGGDLYGEKGYLLFDWVFRSELSFGLSPPAQNASHHQDHYGFSRGFQAN